MKITTDSAKPYFWMVALYLFLAVLAIVYYLLVQMNLLAPVNNLRWVIIHLVALGVAAEFIFGAAPLLVAVRSLRPSPDFQLPNWLLLNGGLIILIAGMLVMNFPLITAGGTSIFLATILLLRQLLDLVLPASSSREGKVASLPVRLSSLFRDPTGAKFYLLGLFYLLIGILVGTGLWQGWSGPLRIATPKEVHVHTNLWGFAALIFAGLLVDLYPHFAGRSLARPKSVNGVFWLMALGALGLVLGPWVDENLFTVGGLALHTLGTVALLVNLLKPILNGWREWSPGIWHLVIAYAWFLLVVVAAPLVVARSQTGAEIAGNGGPILIYGWLLQVGYALIPYLARLGLNNGKPARLGGTWFSLFAMNAGAVIYWASMILIQTQGVLRGLAYLLWILSLLPILSSLKNSIRPSIERGGEGEPVEFEDSLSSL